MNSQEMIYIRVDANEQIAMGHLMRTLSIAEAIRNEGGDCCFITADHNCDDRIKAAGFKTICLDSQWNLLNSEIDSMIAVIQDRQIQVLLVDSYYVTPEYFEKLSKCTKVIYLDDLKAFPYKCHSIINYVIGEEGKDYAYFEGNVYAGAMYAPLRKEFVTTQTHPLSNKLERIMVTTGGADNYHFAMSFVKRFLEDERFQDCRAIVVIGSKSTDRECMEMLYGNETRITLIIDANNMSQLMKASDCIISAGGTTLYEACACKVPTISYAVADNQLVNVKNFNELGGVFYAGDLRGDTGLVIKNILDRLELLKSLCVRNSAVEKMQKVVDGKGAARIARVLMNKEL